LTFVVVGGGFSGVEIVGELNDFVLDSIKNFYHNLQKAYTRIVLVNSGGRILPEVTEDDFQKRLFVFIYCDTETLRLVKICCRIFDPAIYNYFFIKSLQYAGFDQHYLKYSYDRNFKADVHVPCN
jgi:hypothetical protein